MNQPGSPGHKRATSAASQFSNTTGIQFLRTKSQILQQTSAENNQNTGNQINELNEESCELLTEILSILYKTVNRLSSPDRTSLVYDNIITENVLNDL